MDEHEMMAFEHEMALYKAKHTYPRDGQWEIYLAECRNERRERSRTYRYGNGSEN